MISVEGRRLFSVLAVLALFTACGEKRIHLQYRFPAGYEAHYRWSLRAVTSTESPTEQTSTRMDAMVDMRERVRHRPDGRIVLIVHLRPLAVRENGEASPVPPPSSAEYEVDRQGRIRRLLKADLSAGAISSLELDALSTQTRPPLSLRPVRLGGSWEAPLKIKGERTSIDFKGMGRLAGFDLEDRRRLARIETNRRGDITSNQVLNNAQVVLKGASTSRGVAMVDVDQGILYSSTDRSISNFDVLLSERPAAKLQVVLTSRLRLVRSRG